MKKLQTACNGVTLSCAVARIIRKGGSRTRAHTLGAAVLMMIAFSSGAVYAQSRTVRVGVYQNEPKIFVDDNGNASGIFIELLDEIAAQEGWTVVYAPCEWAACLQALEEGQIDLMPDVAYSPERDAKYDFHKIPVLESWSRVYSSSSASISKIPDLNGKRIAVLQGSIQQTVFQQLMDGFGYKVTIVPADSLAQAFALASAGSADAAIANHLFGDYFYQKYGLQKTTIDFSPVALYYATAEGRNHDLLDAIDRYLGKWIPEPDSPYYTTLGHWTEKKPAYRVPQYVFWVIGGITGLLFAAAGMALLLRQQVTVRTRHLELASAELQKSERRYQTLASISPVGIFRTDAEGATTYVNPKWCEISGLSVNDALGDGWLDAVHPDDKEHLRQGWQASTQLHKPSFSDYRFVRPDGTMAWVMGQAVPEMNSENQIVGYVGTITDITDRKQAEEAAREAQERFNQIFHASPIPISLTRLEDGRYLEVNEAFLRVTGYTRAEALGRTSLELNLWVDVNDRTRMVQGIRQQGAVHNMEFTFRTKSGARREALMSVEPLEIAGESAIVAMFHDITDRKRAEAALQASERQLSVIYANISDVLFYLAVEPDDRFRFVSVNSAFLKATGMTEDQVVGKLVHDVIPEPALALVLGNYQEAIRTKKTVGWEEVTVYPAGKKHGEVSITPILDADGNCTQLIGTVHDITERVNAEAELRRLNAELEERVARRTEELKAAMLKAQSADRLKSAFLATMSHELRTPLNSIIGFTGVLLQGLAGPLNAEQTKQLGMTRDSARHLLALINDVLDISKIEAGQLEVARAPFEMRAAIENTLRAVSPLAQKNGLALTASIASNVGVVVSDRRRVEQILLNLLSNAIKFTEHGEVRLACRAQNGWLEISVRDTGIGIRPEDLGKLFEPFHQLETGLNRRHEGTGLGLAICRNLVNLLGGQIRAESEWGAGSTFTFTLPLAPEGGPHGEHPDHRRQ
jgi:PAS domain S-box-containing protein